MSRNSITDLLFTLRCRGITVWVDHGQLRYHAAKEPITTEEIEALKMKRADVLALLQQTLLPSNAAEPELAPRPCADTAPLAFSQEWWWRGLGLDRNPSLRTVFSAVHLSGTLSSNSLRRSFAELISRHESLRTRIITSDGIPTQHIDEPGDPPLELLDLSGLPTGAREAKLSLLAEQIVNDPFFASQGPLFSARILKLGHSEHLLVVALDHMISDGASIGILWRDLFSLYTQITRGVPCQLETIPIQFADYSLWQHNTYHWWATKHSRYWTQRLSGAEPLQLFRAERVQNPTIDRLAHLPIQFGEPLSTALRELSRRLRTTTVMAVLTAYAASLMRLSNRHDLVVPFTTTGRLHPAVENTIGFFGTPTLLRIELKEQDRFFDFLEHVTQEYTTMYEHQDSCRMARQLPVPEVMWNPHFNWIPRDFTTAYARNNHKYGLDGLVSIEPYELEIDIRDIKWGTDISLIMSDTPRGIQGNLVYRANTFALNTMERFLRSFFSCAEALALEPHSRVATA